MKDDHKGLASMKNLRYKNWADFRDFLSGYTAQPRERRSQLVFRGHSDSNWRLKTTLDRVFPFTNDQDREQYFRGLLSEFEKEAIGLLSPQTSLPEGKALELLARHHGVPSPILDWTESSYIASFFAFEDVSPQPRNHVAIWMLDLGLFSPIGSGIDLVDEMGLLRFNRRALRQRGLFTRVLTVRRSVETIMSDALTRILLPSAIKETVLADLDEMGINAAMLFSDLDGAARTVVYRLKGWRARTDG